MSVGETPPDECQGGVYRSAILRIDGIILASVQDFLILPTLGVHHL